MINSPLYIVAYVTFSSLYFDLVSTESFYDVVSILRTSLVLATACFAKVEAQRKTLFAMINETQIFFLAAVAANVGNQAKQVTNTVEGSRGDHDVDPAVCERFKQKQAF